MSLQAERTDAFVQQTSTLGITMDDLDHSMLIAEYDWTSFYEESEECCLLQPSLACPDNSSLSDSEDPVVNVVLQESQQSPTESNISPEGGSCAASVKLPEEFSEGAEAEEARITQEDSKICPDGEEVDVKTVDTNMLPSEVTDVTQSLSPEMRIKERETCTLNSDLNSLDVSSIPPRAEKERWFITVHVSPVRRRVCPTSVKKKRRQKKPYRENTMCRTGQDNTDEYDFEINKEKEFNTTSNHNSEGRAERNVLNLPRGHTSSFPAEDESQKQFSNSPEPSTEEETWSLASQLESVKSDEEDGAEFFSTLSSDSESCLSAVDQQRHCSPSSHRLDLNTNSAEDREEHSYSDTLTSNAAPTNGEGYETTGGQAHVEPPVTFPLAHQRADKTPDGNSTCEHSTVLLDTPGLLCVSASGFSLGDQLPSSPPLPVPDLTVTPAADSPEAYAEATGRSQPVYAISAFWNEMEKLTINDILQLRMARSPSPRETTDVPTQISSPVDSEEFHLPDGCLMDTSDTTDSDYFTQPDDSKPDRSSCEFSTSDFEEEYWQFISASRNQSPDPCSQSQHGRRITDSPFPAHEEDGSTSSEGKETPVPLQDFAGECLEHRGSQILILDRLAGTRQMTKSKSVRDVKALNTEDLRSFLDRDENSSLKSVEDDEDSLGSLVPPSVLDTLDEHHQIPSPQVFEYFLTQDKMKNECICVPFYEQEDISLTPHTTYTFEPSFSSLCDSQCHEGKLIPIFSCSHPTVRELTFPKLDYVFLNSNSLEESVISPFRVVSTGGSNSWKSLLSLRKIRFHNKGSIWYKGSGAWGFPAETRVNPQVPVLSEGGVSSASSLVCGESAVQQMMLETIRATKRESIFSMLKQADMCLVCIAVASWVITSSDPEAADAWKAALLANVSALSAIQYLRRYVKRQNPHEDP